MILRIAILIAVLAFGVWFWKSTYDGALYQQELLDNASCKNHNCGSW